MTGIVVVLGSVTPPGRLSRAVYRALEVAASSGVEGRLIDLANLHLPFADGSPASESHEATRLLVQSVTEAQAVVFASPVYRASLTGALKNALDLLPVASLQSKPAGIVAMGATDHHYLGVESHLRDILAWFGALTAPTAVYLTGRDFDAGAPLPGAIERIGQLFTTLGRLGQLGTANGAGPLTPPPLAAQRA